MILIAAEKLVLLPLLMLLLLAPLIIGMLWLVHRFGKFTKQRLVLYFGGFLGAMAFGIPLPVWSERHPGRISDSVEFFGNLALITLGCCVGVLVASLCCRGQRLKG